MLFEAIIVVSEAVKTVEVGKPSQQVMCRYGQVLKQLREKLLTGSDIAADYVLLAITAILAMIYLLNDMAAFEMHLKGIRSLVAMRGGLDALSWPLGMVPRIQTLEGLWAYKASQRVGEIDSTAESPRDAALGEVLEYR